MKKNNLSKKEMIFFKEYGSSDEWHIEIDKYFTNKKFDQKKAEDKSNQLIDAQKHDKESFIEIIQFLYDLNYNEPLTRHKVKKHIDRQKDDLSPVELLAANKLSYRSSNSKSKYQYGIGAIQKMKKAGYKCEICGEKDLRFLEIDHIKGRDKQKEEENKKNKKDSPYTHKDFQILCSNHHNIKTRMETKRAHDKERDLLRKVKKHESDGKISKNKCNEIKKEIEECDNHSYESSVMKQIKKIWSALEANCK